MMVTFYCFTKKEMKIINLFIKRLIIVDIFNVHIIISWLELTYGKKASAIVSLFGYNIQGKNI